VDTSEPDPKISLTFVPVPNIDDGDDVRLPEPTILLTFNPIPEISG
jgi:hypothetical protein